MMQIRKLDGSSVIEINAIDSRLKMAVDAEAKGQMTKARTMLEHALKAERDLWVAKVAKARMLGEKFPDEFPTPRAWADMVTDFGVDVSTEDLKKFLDDTDGIWENAHVDSI